jgi:hypothetical protein
MYEDKSYKEVEPMDVGDESIDPIKEIERFAIDRNIHQMDYSAFDYIANIQEELIELIGGDVKKDDRVKLKVAYVNFLKELTTEGVIEPELVVREDGVRADAIADVIVFSLTELMKLKFNPSKVLNEVAKEINSRTGSITNGKFEKDLSEEAKALWYKANFAECRQLIFTK